MPEYQKALIVILILASGMFAVAGRVLVPLVPDNQFKVWRNTWLAITLIAFLAGNFWIYILASVTLLLYLIPKQQNPLALYFILLFALPPIGADIPGFGLVNFLFTMDHYRVLSLAILLPIYLNLRSQPDTPRFGKLLPDKLLLTYLILIVLLGLRDTTVSDTMRYGFYKFTDIFLPYYAASRAIKSLNQMKEALIALVIGCAIMAVIGSFEFATKWLLYSPLDSALGIDWSMGRYLPRGEYLRAVAASGQPIVLGYLMMIALGLYFFLAKSIKSKSMRYIGLALLLAGLISPLSRGPWIGAAVLVFVYIATGPFAIKRLSMLTISALMVIPLLGYIPGGDKVINLLPFVGKTETENIDYRAKLLDQAVIVFNRYPMLGSVDYRDQLADLGMKQGEGIVDVVNSYLDVVLEHGLVGLILFLGFFWLILLNIHRGMKKCPSKNSESYMMGRALFSCLVAILITIFTVSSIMVIPIVYWIMAGLGISYARISSGDMNKIEKRVDSVFPTTRLRNDAQHI